MKTLTDEMNLKVFELLEKTELNWTVSKEPLVSTMEAKKTESYGIFRNDSKLWLGTVGPIYLPFQNWEMAEVLIHATENIGLHLSRGGQLDGGKKVYLQASLPEHQIGKSAVKRWVTPLNSHDGSGSFAFGSTNVIVVCQNTFHKAYGELQRFRHTTMLKERVAIAEKNLLTTLQMDDVLITQFKRLAEVPIKDEVVERVMNKLFNINLETKKELSTRRWNQIDAFMKSITTSIDEQGASLWAVFNGVTRYVNYVAAPKDAKAKEEYIMTGGGSNLSNIGFNELMAFVEENTVKTKQFAV